MIIHKVILEGNFVKLYQSNLRRSDKDLNKTSPDSNMRRAAQNVRGRELQFLTRLNGSA